MKKIKKLTLAGILAASASAVLAVSSVVEVLDLSCAVFAGFAVVIAVVEIGGGYPFAVYAAAGALSALVLPAKAPAVFFICFFGFYPMLKARFERLHTVVAWSLKVSAFNVFLLAGVFLTRKFMFIPDPPVLDVVVFLVGNAGFILYDILITRLITLYLVKLRRLLGLRDYFK